MKYPMTIETFRELGNYEISSFQKDEPSAFNDIVRVRRYRITVELIDEPVEIIASRLEKLWIECDNYHHYQPLLNEAQKIGYVFKGKFGAFAR